MLTPRQPSSTAVAGLHAGYLWQIGSVAFGPEIDLDLATISRAKPTAVATTSSCPTCITATSSYTGEYRHDVHWLSTARLRAGISAADWFFFGSVGAAVGGFEMRSGASSFSSSDVAVGYALGGGVEYAWSPNLALRLEYLRYQFPDMEIVHSTGTFAGRTTVDRSLDVIRGGLDWRL